jgi:ABC-type multidrug transport system ATPase subunit
VQDTLRALRGGRTTFIVAHRLATVRDADRILVLCDGRVVGDGTHEALVTTCPTYATLVHTHLAVDPPGGSSPAGGVAAAAADPMIGPRASRVA